MAGITLEQAQTQLDAWIAASAAVAKNQSYKIGEREFTKVNAEHIDRMIDYWEKKVINLTEGRPRGVRIRGISFGGR